VTRGGFRGAGSPYFWQSQFYFFYIVYNVWKNIFEFKFYSGRNPRIFWKYGRCMRVCVCESKSWPLPFFVQQRPNFEWYPYYLRPFWSQKNMPDCRKMHLFFSKFSWGGPPDLPSALAPSAHSSGLRPLTGPPFPKFLDPPLVTRIETLLKTCQNASESIRRC